MNSLPHEPTVECAKDHCWIHNVDEPTDGFMLCGECGHMFVTAAELVDADVAWKKESLRYFNMNVQPLPADQIYSCPHCSHDF